MSILGQMYYKITAEGRGQKFGKGENREKGTERGAKSELPLGAGKARDATANAAASCVFFFFLGNSEQWHLIDDASPGQSPSPPSLPPAHLQQETLPGISNVPCRGRIVRGFFRTKLWDASYRGRLLSD